MLSRTRTLETGIRSCRIPASFSWPARELPFVAKIQKREQGGAQICKALRRASIVELEVSTLQSPMAVHLEKDGNVFVLRLVGEGEHRFNPTSMAAIHKALDEVEQSEGHIALVTTNDGRFFSNGLDLAWLQKNPTQLLSFMQSFMELLWRVLHFPLPTVAAINGHAAAGGFMLALAHDYRVMRTDKGVLYLSEVDIGLPLTPGMNAIVRCKMSPSVFRSAALFGTKFNGRDALKSELVDETGENVEATFAAAMTKAKQLAARKWERSVYKSLKEGRSRRRRPALGEGT